MSANVEQIQDIFHAAADLLDPQARAGYLDRACGGDADVRRRVEALLKAHAQPDSLLDAPVHPLIGAETRTADPTPGDAPDSAATRTHGSAAGRNPDDDLAVLSPSDRPGSLGRIEHYEVLEVLGRGGFGTVYRAFDDKLQRVVAVKVLAPQMAATSPARKRFLREARHTAAIRHDHVVQIYDTQEQPLPYLVMEYVPGETLQQRLDRKGPLEIAEILRIGRQVAEGLAAAHEKGLIHRDIKPANVLIETGGQERVKLTDFGLARAADDASISQSGIVAGTPMYMAPEQAKGDTLDHRADLFSLGSVLYAISTGRPPFRAGTMVAVLKRVVEEDPRPMRDVIPELPAWFCRIVEKLHAKDPAERFQTSREVADLLADCERQLAEHGAIRDFSRIPGGGKPSRNRKVRRFATALCGVAALFWMAILFAEPAWRYATNQAAIEIRPETGLKLITVWRGGHVVAEGYDSRTGPTIQLPPGEYKLEPTFSQGKTVERWEVRFRSTFSSRTEWLGDRAPEFEVRRGELATVRAVIREEDKSTKAPSDPIPAVWGNRSPAVPKSAADVLPYFAGNWKMEQQVVGPDVPPDRARADRVVTFDWVAGGKVLRLRGTAGYDNIYSHFVYHYDDNSKALRRWHFDASGKLIGPFAGVWNPDNRTLQWALRSDKETHSLIAVHFESADRYTSRRVRLDATDKLVDEVLLPQTRVKGPAPLPPLPRDPNCPAEMKVLDRLVGEWRSEVTAAGAPKGQTRRVKAESILGGRFVEVSDVDESTKAGDYAIAWYDAAAKRYRQWFFSGGGDTSELRGTWDDAAKTMSWNSEDGRTEDRWVFKGDDIREYRHTVKDPEGKVLSDSTGVSRRIASPSLPDLPEQVLPALAGTWKGEYTQKIYGGKPDVKTLAAVSVNDWIVGNKWLRQQVQLGSEGFHSVTCLEPNSRTFRDWFFHSRGLIFGPTTGRWDPATRTVTWTNLPEDGLILLMTMRFVDADTVVGESLIRDKEGHTVFEMSSVMKRTTEHVTIDETAVDAGPLPPEMAVLDRLVGDWQMTGVIKDAKNPDGLKSSWSGAARKILGGRVIVDPSTGHPGAMGAYSLATFDVYSKTYGRWLFRPDGSVLEYGGGWDEKTQTMKWHWAGKDGSQSSNTWNLSDANRHDWQVVTKDALGKTTLDVQGTTIRRSEPGWTPLFNGKNLTGWKPYDGNEAEWTVENGILTAKGKPGLLATNRQDYRDFHLRAEVKINNQGNSGIVFRHKPGTHLTQDGTRHYEADILGGSLGHLYTRLGGRELNKLSTKEIARAQSWVVYEVIAVGGHVTVKMDGRVVIDVTEPDPILTPGAIILEHGTAETRVEFRLIEVKNLSAIGASMNAPAVPKTAAEVLPYFTGSWKVEWRDFDPQTPPEDRTGVGYATYDFVAGGKALRSRSNIGRRSEEVLLLHTYDPGRNALRMWQARSTGLATGPTAGVFNPDSRSLTWTYPSPSGKTSSHQFTFVDGNTVAVQLHHLGTDSNLVRVAAMTFTRIPGPVTLPVLPMDPNRPAEMKVLERLVGEWCDELTSGIVTGLQLSEGNTRTKSEPVHGGRWIESVVTYETGNRGDYALVWYDAAVKHFRRWYFNGTSGEVTEFTGTWDEAGKAMTWNSQDKSVILRWTFDDVRDLRSFTVVSRGKVVSQFNGFSRRIKPASLDGRWVFESAEYQGKAVTRDEAKDIVPSEMTLKGDQYVLTWAGKQHEGGLKINAAKALAEIDFTGAVFAGLKPRQAIYQLSGDTLKLCLPIAGPNADPPRPTAFTTDADSKNAVIVYRRDRTAEAKK